MKPAVRPVLLEIPILRPGSKVGVALESERPVVAAQLRPSYTLDELLAQCDANAARSKEDREWLRGQRVGRELL